MQEKPSYVIIGNGIAGVTAAEILRAEDSSADITVVADDPFPVYYRPALKDYLAGRVREDKLWARPNSFYQTQHIRFLAERVVGIQAGQHSVCLQNGRQLEYSRLLLANGARANRLTCPGANLAGVTTLRTVADYQEVVSRFGTVHRAVVSGSGTLALETIETLRHRGYNVTHLLRRRTLWSEVLDATASDLVLQQERRDGVDVCLEDEIAEITGKNGRVSGVVTTSGARVACDMVIVAIGIDPIIDFIKASGIPCGRGVKVDEAMRTSAPDIYAAGDVLETTDALTGRARVIGQWYPAVQQGRAAAYSMLNLLDTSSPFRASAFYNATFLYGLDFASVGLTQMPKDGRQYQEVVADPQARIYRKVLLKDGVPVGALSLGERKGTLAFKRAIDHRVNLTPIVSRLFASDFKLNDWLDQQGVPPALLGVSREGNAAVRQAAYAGGTIEATIVKAPPLIEAFLLPDTPGAKKADVSGETPLSQTKVISIGRQAGAYLLIDNGSVSRRHAEISYANGQYVLRDLGSANGTLVNDKRLESGSTHLLKHNDRIRFGQVAYLFLARSSGKRATQADSKTILAGPTAFHQMATGFYDPTSVDQAPPPQGQPILNADGSLLLPGATSAIAASVVASFKESPVLIMVGRGKPAVYRLKQGKRIKMGRDKANDIVLAEVSASRLHAEVFHGSDGYYIRDMQSSNGVLVNATKIDNPYRLAHGDRIAIGSIALYFISVESQPEAQAVVPAAPANVQCRNCGASNALHARFCTTCGSPVEFSQPQSSLSS
ncbi:MAG TPA: FAD-dependent oxidoreductase [Ktedonobacteraceae bacterium]|nr:FAD-dependent oxidoreductase [Ktedonobacteraceae bacterium]